MAIGQFTPEHARQLYERERATYQLEKRGGVWIGPDVAIEKPAVIAPQESLRSVNIVLNKKDLPQIEITRGAMGSLSLSVRSFFAQSGIEVTFHRNSVSDSMLKDLNDGKDVLIPVDVANYGQRAVELDGKIMRFFWMNGHNQLRGEQLLNVIKSGEFSVDGIEGEDWFLGGYEEDEKLMTNGEKADQGLCVVIRLKPEKLYITYSPEPFKRDSSKSIRDDLATALKPIPPGMKLDFEIGETPRVRLGPDIVAVINLGANHSKRHIYSPLIDSGSDWPIRTETLHGLEYVDFFLYKK